MTACSLKARLASPRYRDPTATPPPTSQTTRRAPDKLVRVSRRAPGCSAPDAGEASTKEEKIKAARRFASPSALAASLSSLICLTRSPRLFLFPVLTSLFALSRSGCVMFRNQSGVKLTPSNKLLSGASAGGGDGAPRSETMKSGTGGDTDRLSRGHSCGSERA